MERNELTEQELIDIDYHLAQMAKLNAMIGIDSTDFEKNDLKLKIQFHEENIKVINEQFYNELFKI
jgi:acyl-coenzyme A thioesterase PaaI-like protein